MNRIRCNPGFRQDAAGREIVAEAGRLLAQPHTLDDISGATITSLYRLHEQLFGWAAVWEPDPPPWPTIPAATPPAQVPQTLQHGDQSTDADDEPMPASQPEFATQPVGDLCPLRISGRTIEAVLTTGQYRALPTVDDELFAPGELSAVNSLIAVHRSEASPNFEMTNYSDAMGRAERRCPELVRYLDRPRRSGGGVGGR